MQMTSRARHPKASTRLLSEPASERLSHLVDHGVLERVPYQDNPFPVPPDRHGRDLWALVTAMRQRGDRWAGRTGHRSASGPNSCDRLVHAVAVCAYCGEPT